MQETLYDLKTRKEENLDCYVRLEFIKTCSHKFWNVLWSSENIKNARDYYIRLRDVVKFLDRSPLIVLLFCKKPFNITEQELQNYDKHNPFTYYETSIDCKLLTTVIGILLDR